MVSLLLGGGRVTKDSEIDLSVGLVLHKKVGDAVCAGESLATIHAADQGAAEKAAAVLKACYTMAPEPPEKMPFIKDIIC